MSLKAKVEAVIYAADEPVTLAQLAGLFQGEVLEAIAARKGGSGVARPAPLDEQPVLVDEPLSQVGDGERPELGLFGILPPVGRQNDDTGDGREKDGDGVGHPELEGPDLAPSPEDEKKAARARDRAVREELRGLLDELMAEYAAGDRGVEIREIAGGFRVATKPEYHDAVRGFVKSLKPPMKLSLQALETLAVIAYKQPVTAPEVSEIRGVDSGGVLGSLVSRKLITTAGRKQVIGRPILYKTTKEFLLRFGLKDLNELPSIEEFEKMAGELADTDAIGEGGSEAGPEIAHGELPFQPNAEEVAETIAEQGEMVAPPVSEAEVVAAVETIEVDVESEPAAKEAEADLPGVEVEPEVKPAALVEAGEAAAPAGQPGEGD
jgi:segregation and condensation protein B